MLRKILNIIMLLFIAMSVNASSLPKNINEIELTAAILVAEAGGESNIGMEAVFEVILNRMHHKHVSMGKIVIERNAFSSYINYRKNPSLFIAKNRKHPHYAEAISIVLNHKKTNLIGNCNFFHEYQIKPRWTKGHKYKIRIGKHLFYILPY